MIPSPTMATAPPPPAMPGFLAAAARMRSSFSCGRQGASTREMPTCLATAAADSARSPESRTDSMPIRRSAATASAASGRTTSANTARPRTCPSQAT